jgi:hypothetical protein
MDTDLRIPLTSEQKELIDRAAADEQAGKAQWARSILIAAAERKLAKSSATAVGPRAKPSASRGRLRRLPASKQKRLDGLMAKNNEGKLSADESDELRELTRQAQRLALDNARSLVGRK